jgi:hypothetical protein
MDRLIAGSDGAREVETVPRRIMSGRSPRVAASALLALALTVTAIRLAACGDGDDEDTSATSATTHDRGDRERLVRSQRGNRRRPDPDPGAPEHPGG